MNNKYIMGLLGLAMMAVPANAQLKIDGNKAPIIVCSRDTVSVDYAGDITSVSVMSNCKYNVTSSDSWLSWAKLANGNLAVIAPYYDNRDEARQGVIKIVSDDNTYVRNLVVKQDVNTSSTTLEGPTRIAMTGSVSPSSQPGEGIARTYDENVSTLYHSAYSGTTFPIVLTYTFSKADHVDYMLYTPRQDGNNNGNFREIVVEYALASAPDEWIKLIETDLEGSSQASQIKFGENGVDNVAKVKVTVKSGANGFASCAEMGFYKKNTKQEALFAKYFADALCTKLRPEITDADIETIRQPYIKLLAQTLKAGNYSTKYRLGEFEAYRPLADLAAELKTTQYNRYENPTGIFFDEGEEVVLFVEGLGDDGASLIVKDFGSNSTKDLGQKESSYALSNGVNVIKTTNRGNGYISYYTSGWETAPNVKIHFAMAKENGYFDLERGDTNEDWVNLLANACSDVIDVRCKRLQVAGPVDVFRQYTPTKGVELANLYDQLVYREREVMGLVCFNKEPKNRQFARAVASGFMHADGIGAAAQYDSFNAWANADNLEPWGMGHELGHCNQVRPGLKWVGCGETTNNIYAAWVQHKIGNGYHRLEDEKSGIDEYSGMRGGRFETYFEENVRKGVLWQRADGPDYHGQESTSMTVNGRTGETRNYDHFVKLAPFWQLLLWTQEAGKSMDAYGKVIEGIRNYPNEDKMTNGELQLKFMRSFCDSTKIDFTDFFERAGMLKEQDILVSDYSTEWLTITAAQVKELKDHIASKNYPKAPAALNYITAYNWETYRDEVKLEDAGLNNGCYMRSTGLKIDNNIWKGAVAYETYDANGNLLRISMFGLGSTVEEHKTVVLYPEGAAYVMAVGYDGTRIKCYEK